MQKFIPPLFRGAGEDPCYEKYVLPFLNGEKTLECYDQDVSVKTAAKRCGFSESHFMKLFREFTGMSFNAYLVNYRLELAARQLSDTGLKVIDIAENCGFRNQSYFTRAFRAKYRETPLEYRKAAHRKSIPILSPPSR